MRKVGFVLLLFAILLGGVAVWGVRTITSSRATASPNTASTTVVVASRPIGFGDPLTPEVLRVQTWPANARPPNSFKTVAELTQGAPRVALGSIAANEPILPARISGPGGRATLSAVIRPGMRASTIRVNDVFGVAGFVLPGDIVDVLITREEDRGSVNGEMRTDVLLERVRVLAVDQIAKDNKNDPVVAKAATIEVTAEQAQKLALAAQVGTLSLALRPTADPLAEDLQARTVRVSDLRLAAAAAPPAKPVVRTVRKPQRARGPAGSRLEIYHGSQLAAVSIWPR